MKNNKKYKDFTECFNSVNAFLDAIGTRPEHKGFYCQRTVMASQDESDDYVEFSGTRSYEEATGLLLNGDHAAAGEILQEKAKIEKAVGMAPKTCRDYTGFMPCVPAYLSGQPRCMINKRPAPKQAKKTLDVRAYCTVPFDFTTREIINGTAKILTAVQQLELNDFQTNIWVCSRTAASRRAAGSQKLEVRIKVKNAGDPLNVLAVAYPMVNPSMGRRHIFRWRETVPVDLAEPFYKSYGASAVTVDGLSLLDILTEYWSVQKIADEILRLNK